MENPVKPTTLRVVKKAKDVKINREEIKKLAKELKRENLPASVWPKGIHYQSKNRNSVLDYIVLLTSINFCFWSPQGKRWEIDYNKKKYNGYFALSLALKSFFEKEPQKANLDYFSTIRFDDFKEILQGGNHLLLLKERWQILKKVSSIILKKYNSSADFFDSAGKKCSVLIEKTYKNLFSFDDISSYNGRSVYLLKRPQIMIADAWGAGAADFKDMDYLTCFPDYKVPQALNHFGCIEYSKKLNEKIENRILIPHNSKQEVEIRSATVWGVEYLKEELAKTGKRLCSFEVDWILWNRAHKKKIRKPYHLTKTVFY